MIAKPKNENSLHQAVLQLICEFRQEWELAEGRGIVRMRLAKALSRFETDPVVHAFVNDLKFSTLFGDLRCPRTVRAIAQHPNGLVLGSFSVPYNTEMHLECLLYGNLGNPEIVRSKNKWDAVAIEVLQHTPGFSNRRFVAFFPEDLAGDLAHGIPEAKAFFFIDRFVQRFFDRTIPILSSGLTNGSLAILRSLSRDEVTQLAHAWTFLHEYAHRAGHMPLPQSLAAKSSRSAAALEELRADLVVINTMTERGVGAVCQDAFLQFVLAERLLRYGCDAKAQDDFDSCSSNLLLGHLLRAGALKWSGSRLAVDLEKTKIELRNLLSLITSVEEAISDSDCETQKQVLTEFVRSQLDISPDGKVQDHPFFTENSLQQEKQNSQSQPRYSEERCAATSVMLR